MALARGPDCAIKVDAPHHISAVRGTVAGGPVSRILSLLAQAAIIPLDAASPRHSSDLPAGLARAAAGGPSALYHRESNQEDFLVLAGECLLLIEGEERPLEAWDFVHCPPETEHIFVGAGDGPCVIFMAGGRTGEKRIVYPRSELALRHRAGGEQETSVPQDAYAPFPRWQPGPPESWDGLPWA